MVLSPFHLLPPAGTLSVSRPLGKLLPCYLGSQGQPSPHLSSSARAVASAQQPRPRLWPILKLLTAPGVRPRPGGLRGPVRPAVTLRGWGCLHSCKPACPRL